jgi:hypothetical protein
MKPHPFRARLEFRRLSLAGVFLSVISLTPACAPGGPSDVPRPGPPAPGPVAAGVTGTVYWKRAFGRTPAQGAHVEAWVQVQTGRYTGSSTRIDVSTNDRGEFHFESVPIGARIAVGAYDPSAWNPCMAFVADYQGSAAVEIDLYPKTESEEWIVDATLAARGPILTGSATASAVPQPDGFVYFEALYETYLAQSPVDASGRYAVCGLPVNLMFSSRVWIENGTRSCDSTGESYAFYSIHPHSPSDSFVRNFDLHRCAWRLP